MGDYRHVEKQCRGGKPGMDHMILIVPIGPLDYETVTALGSVLGAVFHLPVKTGEVLPVPPEAYDEKRRQFRSSFILEMLKPLRSANVHRVLGVIDEDLYVPWLNFVFGVADMENGVAVISLVRLREEFFGLPPDRKLFLERTVKEAIHELGHTFGLGHCPDSRCIMFFSNSPQDTDRKGPSFCPVCRIKLTASSTG
jgi:archaemetzincin